MLHYGRISFPWFNVYRRRVRKIYPLRNFQPLCQRRKRISFSLGYGNQRPLSATWTVTGAGACILGYEPPPRPDNKTLNTLRNRNICAVITGITTGRLIDFGFRDSLNMGACMAPAACDTIARNLQDFHRKPSDYDAIFTGDLGMVGQTILLDLLTEKDLISHLSIRTAVC